MTNLNISYQEMFVSFIYGGILSSFYLWLLWYSLKVLPKIKNKGLFLFISAAIRLFLFLFSAVVLAQNSAGRFLWIVLGFIIIRLLFLSFIKNKGKVK